MPRKVKNPLPDDFHIPDIPKELLDRFVTGPMTAGNVEAVMRKLKKAAGTGQAAGSSPRSAQRS